MTAALLYEFDRGQRYRYPWPQSFKIKTMVSAGLAPIVETISAVMSFITLSYFRVHSSQNFGVADGFPAIPNLNRQEA